MHIAFDTLGHLMALKVTAASEGDRTQVAALAEQMQEVTGNSVELAYGSGLHRTGHRRSRARTHTAGVVKHPMAK